MDLPNSLPTRVNIINDSSKRIKVKIDNDRDRHFDVITNLEPGSRLDGIEGLVRGPERPARFDVIIDFIINPAGPDNNTRLGGFKFLNPPRGVPIDRSDEFTTLNYINESNNTRTFFLTSQSYRINAPDRRKQYWGRLDSGLLDQEKSFETNRALLVNAAPKPTFTIESFSNDDEAGARVWDLRINSDSFML